MKKLSETLTELGIAFTLPIQIKDTKGRTTYYEERSRDGYWYRCEYDAEGKVRETYYENSNGTKRGTPRSSKTCDGKVVVVDGIKDKLKAL
jgi:hypothetical protein